MAAPGSPVRIGPEAVARAALLTCGHYLPVGRARELLEALTAIDVSTGFVASIRGRAARRLDSLAEIRQLDSQSIMSVRVRRTVRTSDLLLGDPVNDISDTQTRVDQSVHVNPKPLTTDDVRHTVSFRRRDHRTA